MNIDRLRDCYATNNAVRAICDHMARRSQNQNETATHRIQFHLNNENQEFRRAELIAAFRALEEAECGRYVEGRRGWPSRFVWEVKSLLVAEAATGAADAAEVEGDDDLGDEIEESMIEHVFILRPDMSITFELPSNLTASEANRLSQFLSCLSFDD